MCRGRHEPGGESVTYEVSRDRFGQGTHLEVVSAGDLDLRVCVSSSQFRDGDDLIRMNETTG